MTTKNQKTKSPALATAIARDEAALVAYQRGDEARRLHTAGRGPELEAAVTAGEAAFAAFADRHRGVFVHRARALGTSDSDLDDVLQEVLVHVMKRALIWRPGGRSPLNWVCEYLDWAIAAAQRGASTIKQPRTGTAPRSVAWPDGFDPSDTTDPATEACDAELLERLDELLRERPCQCNTPLSIDNPKCCRLTRNWLRRRIERGAIPGLHRDSRPG